MQASSDVTQILLRWSEGDQAAVDHLFSAVYEELKRLAHARVRHERPDHTLNTTALVHEAYVRLVDVDRVNWKDRAHFFALASRVMRHVLVNYAHQRKAAKRGGKWTRVELEEDRLPPDAEHRLPPDAEHRLQDADRRMLQDAERRMLQDAERRWLEDAEPRLSPDARLRSGREADRGSVREVDGGNTRDAGARMNPDIAVDLMPDADLERLLALDDALTRLAAEHPRPAKAIEHSYFGGLTNEETAEVLGVSRATVERDLRLARAWLARSLGLKS